MLDIVFSLIAVREATFFLEIAKNFKNDGLKVGFISFHQGASQYIKKSGFPLFCIHEILKKQPLPVQEDLDLIRKKYDLGDASHIYRHESLTTHRLDQGMLQNKVFTYFWLFDRILKKQPIKYIIQELGGFIAPQALFHVSQKHQVKHVFIEPAIFSKHVVFTLNSLYAQFNKNKLRVTREEDVSFIKNYESMYNVERPIAIPYKDRSFFKGASFFALFNFTNFRKLTRKLIHKYVLKYTEEYNAIFFYVWSFFKRFLRYKYNLLFYYPRDRRIPQKYVYFPFHVPLDVQLTVRSPEFLDQISLCQKMVESLPEGYVLLVKEHPASVGAYLFGPLRDLINSGRIKISHPKMNSFELIREACCIITINSKVGIESIIQKKPVIVLGRAFYRGQGVTYDVHNIDEMKTVLKEVLEGQPSLLNEANTRGFLIDTYKWSFAGELYHLTTDNVEAFTNSLRSYLQQTQAIN